MNFYRSMERILLSSGVGGGWVVGENVEKLSGLYSYGSATIIVFRYIQVLQITLKGPDQGESISKTRLLALKPGIS